MFSRFIIASAIFTTTLCVGVAWAADNHKHDLKKDHKHDHAPKHGGIVVEVKDIDFEFVLKPEGIAMHLRGHKAISLEGASAKLSLLNGAVKTDVPLALAGDKFEAKGKFDVSKGTKGVAVLTLIGQAPRTARFEVK